MKPVVIKCVTNCTGFVKLCLYTCMHLLGTYQIQYTNRRLNPINTEEIQNQILTSFRRGSKRFLLTIKYCILDTSIEIYFLHRYWHFRFMPGIGYCLQIIILWSIKSQSHLSRTWCVFFLHFIHWIGPTLGDLQFTKWSYHNVLIWHSLSTSTVPIIQATKPTMKFLFGRFGSDPYHSKSPAKHCMWCSDQTLACGWNWPNWEINTKPKENYIKQVISILRENYRGP